MSAAKEASAPQSKNKKQMNVYVSLASDEYVERISDEVGITKSDFISLLIAYSRKNLTTQEIVRMAGNMMVFGESGV